jgi:hypothetical protein
MGFWKGVQNVVTFGGASRVEAAKANLQLEQNRYATLLSRIEMGNVKIRASISRLRSKFARTKRNLRRARRILFPTCMGTLSTSQSLPSSSLRPGLLAPPIRKNNQHISNKQLDRIIATGCGAGTLAAITAWQGVQFAGTASTGASIAGLHGIAASNAGWAQFGGGSLATGGGGMAIGHILLPAAGVVVCIATSSVMAHKKANEINRLCDQFRLANEKNTSIQTDVQANVRLLELAESNFNQADKKLHSAVRNARKRLFRFGFFSAVYRYMRFRLKGIYYTSDEKYVIERLDGAISEFMASFGALS